MKALHAMLSAGGGEVVNEIADRFGLSLEQAATALGALLPAVAGGIKERLATGDTSGISGLIGGGRFTEFVQDPSSLSTQTAVEQGNRLLDRIFGSENTGHLIAIAADKLGISREVIGRMLPVIASVLAAFLAEKAAAGESLQEMACAISGAGHGIAGAARTSTSKVFG
jgi:hypothetical protein